jgi:hypothetical protein
MCFDSTFVFLGILVNLLIRQTIACGTYFRIKKSPSLLWIFTIYSHKLLSGSILCTYLENAGKCCVHKTQSGRTLPRTLCKRDLHARCPFKNFKVVLCFDTVIYRHNRSPLHSVEKLFVLLHLM